VRASAAASIGLMHNIFHIIIKNINNKSSKYKLDRIQKLPRCFSFVVSFCGGKTVTF
jgi:hypothetical protein